MHSKCILRYQSFKTNLKGYSLNKIYLSESKYLLADNKVLEVERSKKISKLPI